MLSLTVTTTNAGLSGLFALRGYRSIWTANLLASSANGSSRFVFVWLVNDLTDWDAAVALLGIAMGIPALMLSVPGGSLADRFAPKALAVPLLAFGALTFVVSAVSAASDWMSVPIAVGLAMLTGVPLALAAPVLQSVVPSIVPPERLLAAVALQNMGLMLGMVAGALLGGGIIDAVGTAGALAFLGLVSIAGAAVLQLAELPSAPRQPQHHTVPMSEVARDAFSTEPLRTLLGLTIVLGFTTTAMVLLVPVVARDVLGVSALAAGLINGTMGLGMMITSVWVARRGGFAQPARVMLSVLSVGLGTGLFLLGWSQTYWLTLMLAFAWGACGGVAMALMRTLTQLNTPPERMGRIMGLATLAQYGSFPIAAVMLAFVVAATSARDALMISGVFVAVLIWSQWLRPVLRSA